MLAAAAAAAASPDDRVPVVNNGESSLFPLAAAPITNVYSTFYGTDIAGQVLACDTSTSPMHHPASGDGYYALQNSVFTTQPSGSTTYNMVTGYGQPSLGQWDRGSAQANYNTHVREQPRLPPRIKRRSSNRRSTSGSLSSSGSSGRLVVKRSRMGCLTCRLRKKRCCETRPRCAECSRAPSTRTGPRTKRKTTRPLITRSMAKSRCFVESSSTRPGRCSYPYLNAGT